MFFLFDFQFCFVYYPIFLILLKSQIKRPKVSFYLENAQKTKKQFLVSLLLITRNSLRGRRSKGKGKGNSGAREREGHARRVEVNAVVFSVFFTLRF